MDFEAKASGAFRGVLASALGEAARSGLLGDHHFYITVDTRHGGVRIPDSLRALYPETITIVLQHEFWELVVTDEGFSVSLAFNGVSNSLSIPFDAVIGFADPSINFGIQFHGAGGAAEEAPAEGALEPESKEEGNIEDLERKPGDVITLDTFRKK